MADTLAAIAQADLITLGPGSLFTSVIPNLLVEGISAAIRRSPALKAYFVNLMWQPGETVNFSASDHIRAIHKHAGGKLIDCAIVNMAPIQMAARKRYERQQALPVENDLDRISKMGVRVVTGKLLQESKKVRHDPEQTAAVARAAGAGRPAAAAQGRWEEIVETPLTVVILAAGLGTRMKSRKAKVLHRAGGRYLVEHVVRTALALAPPERIFVVVGHQAAAGARGHQHARHRVHSSRPNRKAPATR